MQHTPSSTPSADSCHRKPFMFRPDLTEHVNEFGGQRDVSSFLGLRLLGFEPDETSVEIDL